MSPLHHATVGTDRPEQESPDVQVIDLDQAQLEQLSGVFAAPRWLRDLGIASWLCVGAILLLAGLIWLLGATAEITGPVVIAFLLACVTTPLVRWLARHRVGRAGGAAIVVLGFFGLAVADHPARGRRASAHRRMTSRRLSRRQETRSPPGWRM